MPKIRLVHWNATEAKEGARKLRALGFQVAYEEPNFPTFLKEVQQMEPVAVVIDLSRMPSNGLAAGLSMRERKTTREIPLVFVAGQPQKVERVRKLLPDAEYTTWRGIEKTLKRALARPPSEAIRRSPFDAYAGVALVKKLGVKEGSEVKLIGAPKGFEKVLGALPEGAVVRRGIGKRGALNLWFVTNSSDLDKGIHNVRDYSERGGLWIVWPKKSSGVKSDLTQVVVRKAGLASGMVDYKVASLSEIWTGLRFTLR